MIIIVLFLLVPLLIGFVSEYAVCRLTKRVGWKLLPPFISVVAAVLIAMGRIRIWTSTEVSPASQLLFFPGLPALVLLLGMLVGWRLWRRRWLPRVIRDKGKG